MLEHIEFEVGLLERCEPAESFVVLADPQAIPAQAQARWLTRWRGRCLGWVPQLYGQSTLDAALQLAPAVWTHLTRAPDCVLWAMGGGTTLDLAKVLRWPLSGEQQALRSWRDNALPEPARRHRLWCTPTTAGTGSEVTPWATLWDLGSDPARKRSWHPPQGLPDRALIDPELTRSCPWRVSRDCALDALAHALESLWNRRADAASRAQARQAARRILLLLPLLQEQPQDLSLRARMSHASLLAGLAMARTQTALAHALSYEVTLREGLPHGQACAIWLPMVMELAAQRSAQTRADLEEVFARPISLAVPWFIRWLQAVGVQPRDLREKAEGVHRLRMALASERGSNFVEDRA
jgi:alcohol dehydrogenase class IV